MSSFLGGIFGFGNRLKRGLKDAVKNPEDFANLVANRNQEEWQRDPDERSMGFFNPIALGKISPFMLRNQMKEAMEGITNMSRRDFMKKTAGIAGGTAAASIPGAKLLQKFAPEERAVAKQAAVEAAPKYKYNSLKEYLDDVETKAYSAHDNPVDYQMLGDDASSIPNLMKERLIQDEMSYAGNKHLSNRVRYNESGQPYIEFDNGVMRRPVQDKEMNKIISNLNEFSPQAKKEMAVYKQFVEDASSNSYHNMGNWVDDPLGKIEKNSYLRKALGYE